MPRFRAYTGPVSIEIASWLADFDFRAPLTLYLDPLSLALCLMITFVCGLIHLYSVAYMADDPGYVRYFALLNLFVAAMLLLVLAGEPAAALHGLGRGRFLLLCSDRLLVPEEKNATAGRKAFIVTRIGDVGLRHCHRLAVPAVRHRIHRRRSTGWAALSRHG